MRLLDLSRDRAPRAGRSPAGRLLAAGLLLALVGCAGNPFERGARPQDAAPPVVEDGGADRGMTEAGPDLGPPAVSFENEVHPALKSRCSACHSATGTASQSALVLTGSAAADRAAIEALIVPGKPEESPLLQNALGKEGHEGGAVLTESSSEYQTLKAWVEAAQ